METVLKNITMVRRAHPWLPIKLNIVADEDNNKEQDQFLTLARKNQLVLNVFKEGIDRFALLAQRLGSDAHYRKASDFWCLPQEHSCLLLSTRDKRVFDVRGVQVVLSYTSTDRVRWDAMWISPEGALFCDPEHRSMEVDMKKCIQEGKVDRAIRSMLEEAALMNQLPTSAPVPEALLAKRRRTLPTVSLLHLLQNSGVQCGGESS